MDFLRFKPISKLILILNVVLSVVYFVCVIVVFPMGSPVLFALLIASEIFHIWQVFGFIHTIWPRKIRHRFDAWHRPSVAVFITVCGEPAEIVQQTVKAALAMRYTSHQIYILNDGYVAKRPNWQEAEKIAAELGVTCITRKQPGGAKAGNINHALGLTDEPFVVVFDADHMPKSQFLLSTMGYFIDKKVGFVQSPQYYKNFAMGQVTGGAWEQQALFFGPLLKGKDGLGSTFMCGTNMVIRRDALVQAGGMNEQSIAEDFLTSIIVHDKKWKSVYVDEVLAEGLAPEDFLSYYKQQFRWARGSLEVLFSHNPLFKKGLTAAQKIQYLSSASFYLTGAIVLVNMLLPLLYFYFGILPLDISTMTLALIFLPYIFVIIYTLQLSSNFTYTFRALSFSLSSFPIHLKALLHTLVRKKNSFSVTSKKRLKGNFAYLVWPHFVFIGVVIIGVGVGVLREGWSASLISNMAWAGLYIAIFIPFIHAAIEKQARPSGAHQKALMKQKAGVNG